jgi:hypothetical protein
VGSAASFSVDEKMANSSGSFSRARILDWGKNRHTYLAYLLLARTIYLRCMISLPSLMEDYEAKLGEVVLTGVSPVARQLPCL